MQRECVVDTLSVDRYPAPLRVLLVAEVRLFREGLARALAAQAEFRQVETAAADEALTILPTRPPSLVLADSAIARNTDLVARAAAVGVPVVAIAVAEEDEAEVLACAEAGVAGFVARDATLDDLIAALHVALRGDVRCSPRVAALITRRFSILAKSRPPEHLSLTRRESEIVDLLDAGLSNKEIASRLMIETGTVKNHVHNLLEKLHVRSRGQAAAMVRSTRMTSRSSDSQLATGI